MMTSDDRSRKNSVRLLIVVIVLFLVIGLLGVLGSRNTGEKVFSWFLLIMGVGLIFLAGFSYFSNKKSYHEFYQLFPELNGDMKVALDRAEYESSLLGILIYKGYLVNYRRGSFQFIPLKEAVEIRYRWIHTKKYGLKPQPQALFLMAHLKNKQLQKWLELVPPDTRTNNPSIEAFHTYLNQHFPHIHINQNPTFLD